MKVPRWPTWIPSSTSSTVSSSCFIFRCRGTKGREGTKNQFEWQIELAGEKQKVWGIADLPSRMPCRFRDCRSGGQPWTGSTTHALCRPQDRPQCLGLPSATAPPLARRRRPRDCRSGGRPRTRSTTHVRRRPQDR